MQVLAARRAEIASLLFIAALTAGVSYFFLDYRIDRAFLTFRVVENALSGQGFVFNPGESLPLSVIAPLYALILRLLATIPDAPSVPLLANIVGSVSIGIGGLMVYGLAHDAGRAAGLIAAITFTLFPLLWSVVSLSSVFWLALCLLAIWLTMREAGTSAAFVLALAVLFRADTVALLIALIVDHLLGNRPTRLAPIAVFGGIVALGGLIIRGTFASPPPVTGPIVPIPSFEVLLATGSPMWVPALILVVFGAVAARNQRWLLILLGWVVLHLGALLSLNGSPALWDVLPIVPALAGLIGAGTGWLLERFEDTVVRWAIGIAALIIAVGATAEMLWTLRNRTSDVDFWPAPPESAYIEAGDWLANNLPSDRRIAAAEPATLGYSAPQPILDIEGRLHPTPQFLLAPGDPLTWLTYHVPDAIVLRADDPLASSVWLSNNYRETIRFESESSEADVIVYSLVAQSLPFEDAVASMISLPNGLTINRIATDFSLAPLDSGRSGVVRLEWLLDETIDGSLYVGIRIEGRGGGIAALDGRMVDFSTWPTQRLITSFHPVNLAEGLPPGVYDVNVGLGSDARDVRWFPIAQAQIPFSDSVFLGAFSGARADFGQIALEGYRLARTEEGLEVLLLWAAIERPAADYRVLIQVRDIGGGIAAQKEVEPHEGLYPTSIWRPGDEIPDTYLLDDSGLLPGEYSVYVGLLGPDEVRLRTVEGEEFVFVGRVTVTTESDTP